MANTKENQERPIGDDSQNTVEIREFADRIKSELEASTSAWWKIAGILGEADAQYGFASKQMKALIADINFSASKANKLVKISQSDRLQKHEAEFSKVGAWTVLYKLTSLSDAHFDLVLKALSPEIVVTVAWINTVLGREKKAPKDHKPLFEVQVNVAALKAMEFDGESFSRLEEALEAIKAEVPFLEITDSGLFEDEWNLIGRDMERARKKVLTRLADRAIEQYKDGSSEWKAYRNKKTPRNVRPKRPPICVYDDRTNVFEAMEDNLEEVFSNLGADWFSQEMLHTETTQELHAMRQKYADALRASETPE